MGFFNRPARSNGSTGPVDPNTTTAVGTEKDHRDSHGHHHQGYFTTRPTVKEWVRATIYDFFTMLVLGGIGIGVYFADPAASRSFPVTFADGDVVYPDFAYPLRKQIIPIWASALMSVSIPVAVFLIVQIRVRSFWDFNNAVIGVLYAIITGAVFQVIVKWLIGGLRPHFLEVCQPNIELMEGHGYKNIMYDRRICTGDPDQINDSLESMPSGHTTAAFAGLVFLYLYLNAKLKVFSNYHPSMWKLIAVYTPILGAVLIGGSLTIDEFHNWYDVVAGAILGTIMAFSSYRMVYASVWDFRFNHIPLSRNVPFTFTDGQTEFHGFREAIWTRRAGWGDLEQGIASGAPFDATSALHSGFGSSIMTPNATSNGISRRPITEVV